MHGGFVLWSLGERYYSPWVLPDPSRRTFGSPGTDRQSTYVRSLIERDENAVWKFFEDSDPEAGVWRPQNTLERKDGGS